ncbi:MAG: excinuclease ABC subunit UvrA [Nitrospirae bacterium]|nr:excinuclease ABC subunit UvrA [Nitrospirota bacterium]
MSSKYLIIQGARQNNLKNINLSIPHNKVTVITGISGSGKSSLAFDTIFAEGQWRYIESLSTYTRMFIEKIDRPDVEAIRNIRPAIAIEQKNPVRTSRSTVGTATEIYDYLRLLFAKTGRVVCPECGSIVRSYNPSEVLSELLDNYSGERAYILTPVIVPDKAVTNTKNKKSGKAKKNSVSKKEELNTLLGNLVQRGFFRFKSGSDIFTLPGELPPGIEEHFAKGDIYVVIDRISVTQDSRKRISDSIELGFREGSGSIRIDVIGQGILRFDTKFKCHKCDKAFDKPEPLLFSFNHPTGACTQCKGFGDILQYDEDLIVPDKHLTLEEGAIEPWTKPAYTWWQKQFLSAAKRHDIDTTKPYSKLSQDEKDKIFKGASDFKGINDFFSYLEGKRYKLHVRVFISRYRSPSTCPSCKGTRLRPEALNIRIAIGGTPPADSPMGGVSVIGVEPGHFSMNIHEICSMPVSDLHQWFSSLTLSSFDQEVANDLIKQIVMKLGFLLKIGLDYLTLNRQTKTLSGGESQRINLSNQLGSRLVGTLYVLDEPSIGLHARDTGRLAGIVQEIAGAGNTVIVVEHDKAMIESGDYIVEMGPGGGENGGDVVFSDNKDKFIKSECLTAQYLRGEKYIPIPSGRRKGSGKVLTLSGAREHNLKDITLKIPLRTLACITGVSGSGKSTLIQDTLYRALARVFRLELGKMGKFERLYGAEHLRGVKLIDQKPIGKTPRSNPITYIKGFDVIRKLFASQREARIAGLTPSAFSFNTKGGRCEGCQGSGWQRLEMYFFEDLYVTCDKCEGERYRPEVLKIKYKGKNISDILRMTISEAEGFFKDETSLRESLRLLDEMGLGYLRLGQPATTLSGGEAQRLKICSEIWRKDARDILYLLDEPTTGLHFDDTKKLLNVFNRLVERGNTVVVIEHNMDVIKSADYIIDLGPEGGENGGNIVTEGTPEEVADCNKSHTGMFLKESLHKMIT